MRLDNSLDGNGCNGSVDGIPAFQKNLKGCAGGQGV